MRRHSTIYSWTKKTGFNLGYDAGVSCTFNLIVTRTYYFTDDTILSEYDGYLARNGALLNSFVNSSDPAWSVNGLISLSRRSKRIKLSSSLKLSGGFDHRSQYLLDKLAHVETVRAKVELVELLQASKRFSLTCNLRLTYLRSHSDLGGLLSS